MLKKKYGYDYYFRSIYDIPFSFYKEHRINTLFVDLDNTLVEDEERTRPTHFDTWYAEVTNHGLQLFVVSNNTHASRLGEFMEGLPIKWYHNARKQTGKVFKSIMMQYNLRADEIAVIGDRVFTDVAGGNKIGALTILTEPIIADKNSLIRWFVRPVEKVFFSKAKNGVEQ